jgi:hypothetical protein
MRASHRGAYEHLWAEQKYAVLASSFGAFKSAASRFSARPPQFLGFLAHLARIADRPVGEWRNAWLHVYDHLRPHLSAVEQRRVIEGIVNDDPAVGEEMYRLALRSHESSLFGCRLFFPRGGFYKIWDPAGEAGLWILLGPFLGHYRPGELLVMTRKAAALKDPDLFSLLDRWREGIPRGEYTDFPPALRELVRRWGAVAEPGEKVYLHPRFPNFRNVDLSGEFEPEALAVYVLEHFWDSRPERVPGLPTAEEWGWCWREVIGDHCPESEIAEVYRLIREEFIAQAQREQFRVERLWETPLVSGAEKP